MDPWKKSAAMLHTREDVEAYYAKLLSIKDILAVPSADRIHLLGDLIDLADGYKDAAGSRLAIEWITTLETQPLLPDHEALLFYFASNAWSDCQDRRQETDADLWRWDQQEFSKRIIYLRRCRQSNGFPTLSPLRQAQAITNLGNVLSTVGRPVAALATYRDALVRRPNHAMAQANMALTLKSYANHLNSEPQRAVLLRHAEKLLDAALRGDVEPHARNGLVAFSHELANDVAHHSAVPSFETMTDPLGDSGEEQAYRRWCLNQHLFLNPVNDAAGYTIASADVTSIDPIYIQTRNGPWPVSFFNQIKLEFGMARWLLWESVTPHTFADRRILLFDSLDGAKYDLQIEQMRLSLRSSYSLLDKVAYFLNEYFVLGIPQNGVSYRNMWFKHGDFKQGFNPKIAHSSSLPLRGLFWLGKDLFERDTSFKESLEPDGRLLAELRNALEHQFVKAVVPPATDPPTNVLESFSLKISLSALEAKSMRVLRLSREAIIYLAMTVNLEERKRVDPAGMGCHPFEFPMYKPH